MLSTQELTTNARDRTALTYLKVGLDEAMDTGKPSAVRWIPTSHTDRQLADLATQLVLVLGGGPITFVPMKA